jgi:hypothetical protein
VLLPCNNGVYKLQHRWHIFPFAAEQVDFHPP